MANSGYPTPDIQTGDVTYGCIPIIVPNNPEFNSVFAAAIYGLYAQMSKEYFWRKFGTMTAAQAAQLSSYGLALTQAYEECSGMTDCGDVAACIESELLAQNTALINSLTQTINNNGFGNPNRINPTLTTAYDRNPIGALSSEIIPLENCNLDALWSGLRYGIVARLDDSARDLLEDLTAIPNVLERLAVFIDVVPIIGDLAEGLALQITEVVPDLIDLYNSYSSESALDEIACDLFTLVCATCKYPTFEQVFEQYLNNSISGIPNLASATLETIAEYVLQAATNPAALAYNTIMVWQLFTLNAQAAFNGLNGTQAIVDMALLGEDFMSDNWKQLCDGCNEAYAVMVYDYTRETFDSYKTLGYSTSNGTWVAGQGWRADRTDTSDAARLTVAQPIDPSWVVRSVAYEMTVGIAEWTNFVVTLRTIPNSNTGSTGLNMTVDPTSNPNARCRDNVPALTNFSEIASSTICNWSDGLYLKRLVVIYTQPDSAPTAKPQASSSACDYIE